jgi:signal transduction histidine kinase
MTSIKGFADLLLGGVVGPLNEQQRNFLNTIRSNVERMNTLVSDLNDVTKLQTNRMHMEKSAIAFYNVMVETLRPLQRQIEDKGQTLVVQVFRRPAADLRRSEPHDPGAHQPGQQRAQVHPVRRQDHHHGRGRPEHLGFAGAVGCAALLCA